MCNWGYTRRVVGRVRMVGRVGCVCNWGYTRRVVGRVRMVHR